MPQKLGDVLVRRPTEPELTTARDALRHQQDEGHYTCGCFVALCRNPLNSSLEGHWHTYHPSSLAILREAQANCLARLAVGASALDTTPKVN